MRAFHFRLERVLEWRRRILEQALAHQEKLRSDAVRLEAEIWKRNSAMVLKVEPLMSGLELATFQRYLGRLRNELIHLEEQRRLAVRLLREQTGLVLQCDRNVKILERLHDRRLQEWRHDFDKELEDLAADLISNRWSANGSKHREPTPSRSSSG